MRVLLCLPDLVMGFVRLVMRDLGCLFVIRVIRVIRVIVRGFSDVFIRAVVWCIGVINIIY